MYICKYVFFCSSAALNVLQNGLFGFPGHVCVWGRGTGMIKGSLTHASISSVSFGSKKLPIIELDQVD